MREPAGTSIGRNGVPGGVTVTDGLMVRAHILALWDQNAMRYIGPGHYLEDRMLAALLRDMVGEPAGRFAFGGR